MAYVTSYYPRTCDGPSVSISCPRVAAFVVRNRFNADIRYFCAKHHKQAEALAKELSAGE